MGVGGRCIVGRVPQPVQDQLPVAVFLAHQGQLAQLNQQGGWALERQGMFFVAAVAIALLGPGRFSANGR